MKYLCALWLLLAPVANKPIHFYQYPGALSIEPAMQPLPFAAIKPGGWLLDEINRNLKGFTGHLDRLAPDLVVQDDIYGKDRLSRQVKSKDVGAIAEEGDWQVQILWWNSETQCNWLDGLVRSAILAGDRKMIEKAETNIKRLLATQDSDGYLGIYDAGLRYQFDNENGELWAKATLYRALLAWYEYSGDKTVLTAVVRATDNVLAYYPVNKSHPFLSKNPNTGGLSHGLVFTDVLERLFFLTGQKKYLDYCAFLYKDFSEQVLNEDAQLKKLLDTSLPLKAHGVHTYEHLRALLAAYYARGNPDYKTAIGNFLLKVDAATTPSGGLAGDEFIGGRKGDATQTGYEFCSLHEGMASFISLLEKSGDSRYGFNAEKILFNAAMGATHPNESAICYLKTDNSYYLTGSKNGDTTDKRQTRYRYSPVHKEAAVCCVPNAGRILPYYVQSMWMRDKDGLVATLLGPCMVTARIGKWEVSIREETNYPFEDKIRFSVSTNAPGAFTLKIIKPVWAKGVKSSLPFREENGFLVFNKQWGRQDSFDISFEREVASRQAHNGEVYFEYGPLALCRPLDGEQTVTRQYGFDGFRESVYKPLDTVKFIYSGLPISVTPKNEKGKITTPGFSVPMVNPVTGRQEPVALVPMYHTILRQVSFRSN